jgi:hypothetical protein
LNELVRDALAHKNDLRKRKREFRIRPEPLGIPQPEGINYHCTEQLLEYLEAPDYRGRSLTSTF